MTARTKKGTFAKGQSGNPGGRRTRKDNWSSVFTGIGNSNHDKRLGHTFAVNTLSYQEMIDLVEGDDLGERAVKAPIDDSFRQGFEISIADEGEYEELKTDIEKRLRDLKAVQIIRQALYQKRALGGSAIMLGVKDYRPLDQPINPRTLRGIEFLTVLEPMMLTPYKWYDDPTAARYGEVELWTINQHSFGGGSQARKVAATKQQSKSQVVHESRLIILNNDKLSVYTTNVNPAGDYWGQSILVKLYEILRDFNISWAAAGLLVTDFSQGVFGIAGLMDMISRDPEGMLARMRALDTGKSVARSIMIDKDHESFERKSTNVTGLPDLLHQLSRRLAAAIDIPLSVLMGGAEKTDAAEMSNELRYYYDKCASMQRDEIEPILRYFIETIIRGLRQRKIPKNWAVKWHPLWQLTDEQKANARLAQARVDAIYIQHGVLDPQTVALARFSGEYSWDTPLADGFEAPGFMALPPQGVLVDGMDPNTGLPPGVEPPAEGDGAGGGTKRTAAVSIKPHARNKPRKKNAAKSTFAQAGGATAGKTKADMGDGHCTTKHESVGDIAKCEHCTQCDDCGMASAMEVYKAEMTRLSNEIAAQSGEEPIEEPEELVEEPEELVEDAK